MRSGINNNNNLLKVLFEYFDVFALPIVSLVYPLQASVKAIETKSRQLDDHQWLTYWVLYSLITLFELTFAKVLELFPIWTYAKLIGTCWLIFTSIQWGCSRRIYLASLMTFYPLLRDKLKSMEPKRLKR